MRVIAGEQWIDPDGGTRTFGVDRRRIAYVGPEGHERYARLELSVHGRAVVASGLDGSVYQHRDLTPSENARVDRVIERLRLKNLADRPLRSLSFGQVRRLLIARALAGSPAILVLDEFTNGLDHEARTGVIRLLDELAPDVQLVMASHRHDDFPAAITHTATLRGGRIASFAAGRPADPHAGRIATSAADAGIAGDPTEIARIAHADVYRGETLVLRDLSFTIAPGEHTAVFGENGTGKSTFARLVAGTLSPVFGAELLRFGKPGPFDLWSLKQRVAHLSDDLQIDWDMNESVEDAIISGYTSSIGLWHVPSDDERRGAAALIDRLDIGALRARRFIELSFGERRKVLIARALVRKPALLILDEIWNGLDAAFRTTLTEIIDELAADGTTLLAIAHHDADLPALIRRRFTLANGGLVPL